MTEDLQILFERHAAGQLTPEELAKFDKRLSKDVGFKEQHRLFTEMQDFLVDKSEKGHALDALRSVGEEVREQVPTKKLESKPKRKPFPLIEGLSGRIALAVLALALIGTIVYLAKKTPTKAPTYAELYVEPAWPVERSGDGGEISIAIATYLNGQAENGKQRLRRINSSDSKYWLAEIYAKEEKHDSVLHYTSTFPNNHMQIDKAIYLEIVATWYSGKKAKAKTLIDSLPDNYSIYYLKKINKLR